MPNVTCVPRWSPCSLGTIAAHSAMIFDLLLSGDDKSKIIGRVASCEGVPLVPRVHALYVCGLALGRADNQAMA
jgi:hypothetical protein